MTSPLIVQGFLDQYLRPGSNLSITCHVTGNPTPTVIWSLDDLEIDLLTSDQRYITGQTVTQTGTLHYHKYIIQTYLSRYGTIDE